MANSKHAHFRYNILDRCFRRRHNPMGFEELKEELDDKIAEVYPNESISTRTLRSDIATFRDKINGFGAPLIVQKDKGKDVYYYSASNYSIANERLLPYENYLIEAAQQLLERYDENPKYDKLSEALVLFQDQEGVDKITNYEKILFYDKNEAYEGLSHLKPIFLAIKNKKVLKISFQAFNSEKIEEYYFQPYTLKQYNQRWFVFGYNESKAINHWSIPLDDRLKSYKLIETSTIIEDQTDWANFFNEMVGVRKQSLTQEGPISERVTLKFSPKRLDYFKTKPIHPYWDEFTQNDKRNQVFFETIINLELVQQILSYGSDVEVIEPESLRKILREQSLNMRNLYLT